MLGGLVGLLKTWNGGSDTSHAGESPRRQVLQLIEHFLNMNADGGLAGRGVLAKQQITGPRCHSVKLRDAALPGTHGQDSAQRRIGVRRGGTVQGTPQTELYGSDVLEVSGQVAGSKLFQRAPTQGCLPTEQVTDRLILDAGVGSALSFNCHHRSNVHCRLVDFI
jgi:hypothetical protein